MKTVCGACPAVRLGLLLLLAGCAGIMGGRAVAATTMEQVYAAHPEHRTWLVDLTLAVAGDARLEAALLEYVDSLAASPELLDHERAYHAILAADSLLNAAVLEVETLAAHDPLDPEQPTVFDSLLAAVPDLAIRVRALERTAGDLGAELELHIPALSYLWANLRQGGIFYAEQEGPTTDGRNPSVEAYADYLRAHLELYAAWRALCGEIWLDQAVTVAVESHWQAYFARRPPLRRAWWRYRLRAARDPVVHNRIWKRRLYLGARPALNRSIWRLRLLTTDQPLLRASLGKLLNGFEAAQAWAAARRSG